MSCQLLQERFGSVFPRDRERFLFIGDSPNDAPMFAYFPHAVGVANVRQFADSLDAPPAYITRSASGAGFVELADRLLHART